MVFRPVFLRCKSSQSANLWVCPNAKDNQDNYRKQCEVRFSKQALQLKIQFFPNAFHIFSQCFPYFSGLLPYFSGLLQYIIAHDR